MPVSETKILCAHCRRALYRFYGQFRHGEQPNPSQFLPVAADVPVPQKGKPLLCTCGQPFYLVNARTGGLVLMTDKGWRPTVPEGRRVLSWEDSPLALRPETPAEFRDPDFKDPLHKREASGG